MDPVMQALAKALAPYINPVLKHTTPTGTPSTPYYFGPGGIFGVAGLERDLFSTRIQPRGLASELPAFGSMTTNPLFPFITGFLDVSGSNPDGVCEDCKQAGNAKTCIQTAQFGRYCLNSREVEIDRVGQVTNRGEFQDLQLVNEPLVDEMAGILAQQFSLGRQDMFNAAQEVVARFIEVGVGFQNMLCPQVFYGNPANNSANGGYKEFPGLDILVGTAHVDAIAGTDCPSLDSDVKDFNYKKVDDVDHEPTILTTLSYLLRYLRHNASGMNFGQVVWKLVMREELFWEITKVWSCMYMTDRCRISTSDDVVGAVSMDEALRLRKDMRDNRYLLIDDVKYEVIFDDCITEETSGDNRNVPVGCYASDIYVLPFTVRSGFPVLYWQYLDYSKGALPAARDAGSGSWYWTDGGRFLWHAKPPVNWCLQNIAKIEPRIILRTPQLAGRLTNVVYCPLQHMRDALPTQPYWVNGGVSTGRPAPSLYSEWNLPQ